MVILDGIVVGFWGGGGVLARFGMIFGDGFWFQGFYGVDVVGLVMGVMWCSNVVVFVSMVVMVVEGCEGDGWWCWVLFC